MKKYLILFNSFIFSLIIFFLISILPAKMTAISKFKYNSFANEFLKTNYFGFNRLKEHELVALSNSDGFIRYLIKDGLFNSFIIDDVSNLSLKDTEKFIASFKLNSYEVKWHIKSGLFSIKSVASTRELTEQLNGFIFHKLQDYYKLYFCNSTVNFEHDLSKLYIQDKYYGLLFDWGIYKSFCNYNLITRVTYPEEIIEFTRPNKVRLFIFFLFTYFFICATFYSVKAIMKNA